jgi:hypothetical protein
MKYKIFLLSLLMIALQTQAQQNTFSERAYRIGPTGRVFMASTLTPQGNILFSGAVAKSAIWEQAMFYSIKPNLDTLWSRKGPRTSAVEQGVAKTADGGFVFAGSVDQQVNNKTSNDILLNKLNANGQQAWIQTYSAGPGLGVDGGYSLLTMPDKGYILGGYGGVPNKQVWYSVMRTDSLGNIKWRRSYDWSPIDYLATMCFTNNGNILTVGTTRDSNQRDHIKLLLINPNGDSLKSNILNVNGLNRVEVLWLAGQNLLSLSDGGFLINARVDTTINGSNAYLGMMVKVDSNLQLVWKHVYRPFFTPWRDFIKAEELADGTIVVAAFDRFSNIQPATSNIYLHHISAQGAPISIHTFTSTYPVIALYTMQVMPDSSFIVGGLCYTANNDRGFYAAKLKVQGLPQVITGLPAESIAQKAELGQSYPNPTTAMAIIPYTLPVSSKQAQIIVRDITGREVGVYRLKPSSSSLEINLSNLHNGLYTYTLVADGKPVATKKLAIMK